MVLSSGAGSVFGASQATVDAAKERAVLAEKVERVQEDVDDLDSKVDRLFDLLTRRGEP